MNRILRLIGPHVGKCPAVKARFETCHTVMLSMGGMGYVREYHVERSLREVLMPRAAPVSRRTNLNILAEKVPDLPKSY